MINSIYDIGNTFDHFTENVGFAAVLLCSYSSMRVRMVLRAYWFTGPRATRVRELQCSAVVVSSSLECSSVVRNNP